MEKPSGYTVLLDSSVLFPIFTSNLLLFLAERQIFRVRWSQDIHREWINSRMVRYPDGDIEALQRRRDRMDQEFEEASVTGYEPLIDTLSLRDPNDRHVLAAAIKCQADVIVTENLRHFPASAISSFGLIAQSSDDFIAVQNGVTAESATQVAVALVRHRRSLTRSRLTWKQYFEQLQKKLPNSYAEFNDRNFRLIIAGVIKRREL